MKFDSKVKGGLAWAGLFVILAVPTANLFFGAQDAPVVNAAVSTESKAAAPALKVPAAKLEVAQTDPVQTSGVAAPAAKSADVVDNYVKSGKKLPAYISDADAAPATKPAAPVALKPAAPVTLKPAAPVTVNKPVEVASVAPVVQTPPVPLPRDARPKTPVVAVTTPAAQKPLVIEEPSRAATLDKPRKVEPFPPSDAGDNIVVTGDQLEEWDSGSLADYLARKGLLNEGGSNARPDDGYMFNEGPSRPRRNDSFLF
jgi:hypothetical protein